MPKVIWKKFLKGEEKLESNAKRKMLYEIRQRARRCMKDLTLIVENMENVTDKPAKQFVKIFTKEVYHPMHKAVMDASRAGQLYKQDMVTDEQIPALILALHQAEITFDPNILYNRSYRIDMSERLKEKEFKDNIPYFKNMRSYVLKVKSGKLGRRYVSNTGEKKVLLDEIFTNVIAPDHSLLLPTWKKEGAEKRAGR